MIGRGDKVHRDWVNGKGLKYSELLKRQGRAKSFKFVLQPFADDTSPDDPYTQANLTQEMQCEHRRAMQLIRMEKVGLWNLKNLTY
jgi:hypothetical protein